MNNNQRQPQNAGSEGISATLQVATAITTSDQLIAEDIEGKTFFTEPEILQLDVSQPAYIESTSDDETSETEDSTATKQVGPSALSSSILKAGVGVITPGALSGNSPQMSIDRSISRGPVSSDSTQTLDGVTQSTADDSAEEDMEDDEIDQALNEAIEEEINEDTQTETPSESIAEPLEEVFQDITVTEISALKPAVEEVTNKLPVIEVVDLNTPPKAEPVVTTANEDSRYYFSVSDFGYRDADGDVLAGIIISQLPQQGKLQFNGVDVSANQGISTSDVDYLSFLPPPDQHGSYGFGFKVTDGDLESREYTLTLNIAPIADRPLLEIDSSSQLFMTDFQKDASGWHTDNPSGYLELNPETSYGGSNPSNRVLEVEAAAGDNSLYRIVPTDQEKSYQLNVEFSPRQNFPDSNIDVLWGGNVVATLDGSSGVFSWDNYSLVLSGDGTDKRLEFKAADSNGVGGLLDNIELVELYGVGLEDQPVSVSVKASLTDKDSSEQLSLKVSELPEGSVLSDGSQVFIASEMDNEADISEWNSGKLTITPPDNFHGVFDIVYTATATETETSQPYSTSKTVSVTVLSVDDPLVAHNDQATVSFQDNMLISPKGVLANDSDPDVAISVISVNGNDVATAGYAEVEGMFGILTINTKGQWTYTSDAVSSNVLQLASESLQEGLEGHWTFDGNTDELLADHSFHGEGRNDEGRLSGGASLGVPGVSGNAVALDGQTGQVLVDDSTDINLQYYLPSRSLSLAFNLDPDNSRTGRQVLYEEGASVNGIVVYIDGGELYAGAYNKTTGWQGNYLSEDISNLASDSWHHIALVLDSGSASMAAYLDGVAFSEGTTHAEALSAHSGDIAIGGPSPENDINVFHNGLASGHHFFGSIDDVRIYNRALSEMDVQAVRYDFEQFSEQFQYTVSNGDTVESALLTINVIKEPFASGDLLSESANNNPIASITSSQLTVHKSDQGSVVLEGRILSDDGFSSIEHWHLFHKGGALDIGANVSDGMEWLSSFRLFDTGIDGQAGQQVVTANVEVNGSIMHPVLSLDDLVAGQYILAVGNEGFTEADAFSLLDYANSSSGSYDYQLMITGNTDIHYIAAHAESYGQIQSQTYAASEVKIQFAVDLNTESTPQDLNYYFELASGNDLLSQDSVRFPSGESSLEITATINNNMLDPVTTLDDIQIKLYGVDSGGVIQASQTFLLDSVQNQTEGYEASTESELAEDLDFLDVGLGVYELVFSELMDDMQNPLLG